jgi:hypothetical protein
MTIQTDDFSMKSTREILDDAISLWTDLTGGPDAGRSFSYGELSVGAMNDMLHEALELDPDGATAYMMLEVFLREFLEAKTYTVASIMQNFDAAMSFMKDAQKLFGMIQGEHAVEVAAGFRARVIQGLERYGAARPDVLEMVNDPDVLPFLRRDALRSMKDLGAYQFLAGKPDTAHPQLVQNVYHAWSINDLLISVRDMPVSGIALVLLRDATHPDRSYFCFAMRNGENVTILTDRTKPAYPGQDDVLAGRGSRGMARRFARRESANHFPYQIIPTRFDDRGDVVFERENGLVPEGLKLVPLMKISDLPPHQAIWVTMMLSLVADRFWNDSWSAPELSYTGEMVRKRSLLVEAADGSSLPVAAGYRPIELDDVKLEEFGSQDFHAQLKLPSEGLNEWLEKRYADKVPSGVLNIWAQEDDDLYYLPRTVSVRFGEAGSCELARALPDGIATIKKSDLNSLASFNQPARYDLRTFSGSDFGTESELRADRLYIARKNHAAFIQKCVDEEFAAREEEVMGWYSAAIKKNFQNILGLIAAGEDAPVRQADGTARSLLKFGEISDENKFGDLGFQMSMSSNAFGGRVSYNSSKWKCCLDDTRATYRACFSPRHLDDLIVLTGLPKGKIPDVLHHVGSPSRASGNHLLNRMDPMDTDVKNPWTVRKLSLSVNVYLSRLAYRRIQKEHQKMGEA